jgi:hypothetical protein
MTTKAPYQVGDLASLLHSDSTWGTCLVTRRVVSVENDNSGERFCWAVTLQSMSSDAVSLVYVDNKGRDLHGYVTPQR